MNVGKWFVLGMAIVLVAAAAPAARAQENRPTKQALSEMGLGGLVAMSDDDAMAVRGRGFMGGGSSVQVFGNSFATINGGPNGGAHSENGYAISGNHFAAGANGSVAGVIHVSTGGNGGNGGNGGMTTWTRNKMGNGGYGGMGGNGMGGNGSRVNIHATVFFAGGFSVGVAH